MDAYGMSRRVVGAALVLALVVGTPSSVSANWSHGHDDHHEHHGHHHGRGGFDHPHDVHDHVEHRAHQFPLHSFQRHRVRRRHRQALHRAWPYGFADHGGRRPYRFAQHHDQDHTEPHGSSTDHHAETLADLLASGDASFKRSDYAHAVQTFGEAAVRYPQHPIAYFAHGHSLFALGRYAEAASAIRDGMARYPDWGNVRMNRRSFYTDPAEFDAQFHHLEAWVEAHPEDADALFLLGYHYYFTQQPHKARSTFERVTKLNAQDREARYFLSLLVAAPEV